ncbi:hypothetical protein AVEN_263511-1 [Araneus ventricosus]|uniref:Uncharacterized protein n=1 Tax=Araneus ventricosus TaxID=182803 RepID=A0A4Y2EYU5_ARAVE|nr:hypothetical protein AVEN_263511-1 [Araneus ventricosus]
MQNRIQSNVDSQVGEINDQVNIFIEKIEDVQSGEREIKEVKGEVRRKIEEVEDKVQEKIEEVDEKVQGKIGEIENRIEGIPINFLANPDLMYYRPTVKSLIFDRQTPWTVFKIQFDVVNSTNGWSNRLKASQFVTSLLGSAAEFFKEFQLISSRT